MYDLIDLREENLEIKESITGTPGCYIKLKKRVNGVNHYVKFSDYHIINGFVGYESVCEVIVARLGKILGLDVLEQKLIKTIVTVNDREYITFACDSKSYKKNSEVRVSGEDFYYMYKSPGENPDKVFRKAGFSDFINTIYVFDYLIINRDRHAKNIEFLFKNGKIRSAPLFDNGYSLLAWVVKSDIPINTVKNILNNTNSLGNFTGNNFLGSRVLEDNLRLVSKPVVVNKLQQSDKRRLFYNMSEVIPDYYKNKIWDVIYTRYLYLKKRGVLVEK